MTSLTGRDEEEAMPEGSRREKEGRQHQVQAQGSCDTPSLSGTIKKLTDRKSWEVSKEGKEGSKVDQVRKESGEAEKPRPRSGGRKPGTTGTSGSKDHRHHKEL